jgi:hypothetical protein
VTSTSNSSNFLEDIKNLVFQNNQKKFMGIFNEKNYFYEFSTQFSEYTIIDRPKRTFF